MIYLPVKEKTPLSKKFGTGTFNNGYKIHVSLYISSYVSKYHLVITEVSKNKIFQNYQLVKLFIIIKNLLKMIKKKGKGGKLKKHHMVENLITNQFGNWLTKSDFIPMCQKK